MRTGTSAASARRPKAKAPRAAPAERIARFRFILVHLTISERVHDANEHYRCAGGSRHGIGGRRPAPRSRRDVDGRRGVRRLDERCARGHAQNHAGRSAEAVGGRTAHDEHLEARRATAGCDPPRSAGLYRDGVCDWIRAAARDAHRAERRSVHRRYRIVQTGRCRRGRESQHRTDSRDARRSGARYAGRSGPRRLRSALRHGILSGRTEPALLVRRHDDADRSLSLSCRRRAPIGSAGNDRRGNYRRCSRHA